MHYEIPVFFACVLLSGFFSGSETAMIGASRLRLRRLAEEGDATARSILDLVHQPRRLLAGILVGNNIVNILAAVVAGSYFTARYANEGMGALVATAVTTPIIVVFAEYLPKTLAALRPIRFARLIIRPLRGALVALTPIVWPLEMMTRPLGVLLRRKDGVGLADVRGAVAEGVRTGALDSVMARVLHGGLSLEWKTVADILVPRVDVVAVDTTATFDECLDMFRREGYSRLLVKEESLDRDVGYLAAKDLLSLPLREREGWVAARGVREALRVPETLALPRLLHQMRRSGVHLAVVKDEYGGTEGIVTLEDVLEEVVGEIRDEHDVEEMPPLRRLGSTVWLARGDLSLRDVNERLGLSLPAGESRTIGGYVAETLGRVPAKADVLTNPGVRLIVTAVEENRVLQVRIVKEEAPPE